MNSQLKSVGRVTGMGILLISALIVFTFSNSKMGGQGSLPTGVHLSPSNLIGKSHNEIGQIAQYTAKINAQVRSGTPQVLLVRDVKRTDLPVLGLQCMPDPMTIEEPPLVLVVLKGDFQWQISMNGGTLYPQYLVYIFDIWAGIPAQTEVSTNGGRFRKVLNDPSLPVEAGESRTILPCPEYAGSRTLHYGDIPPTSLPPTPAPTSIPAATPTLPTSGSPLPEPQPSVPMPVTTRVVPILVP